MEKDYFIEANGIKIFCDIAGEGFPLVFLHGNGETHEIFKEQIAFFQQYFKVIALDTRGHGLSKNDGRALSISLLASDLKEVLDCLQISKAHIIGFSDGGNVALQFASVYYEYVEKLILVGANANPSGLKFFTKCSIQKDYYEAKIRSIFMKKYKEKANVLQLMTKHPHISKDELQLVRAQTLILAGENDMITKRHLKYIRKNVTNSLLQIIPHASHFLIQEYPDLFNELVLEFINL